MMIISAALLEQGLQGPAAEVLTGAIARLSEGDQDRPQLAATYRQLAEVRKAQGDYAAAGKAYERVAELTGAG
jgi:tetratricopeptide (TPR) repeat protein